MSNWKSWLLAIHLMLLLFCQVALALTDRSDGCTTITVGKKASLDGSVMTSHTLDDHRATSAMEIQPARDHAPGEKMPLFKIADCDTTAMPSYAQVHIGEIPQVPHTYGYINTALPCMNEVQLAIGESTFGGREELQSDAGLIDLWRLVPLLLQRCHTAREAIRVAGELTAQYGWRDAGECLTIADTREVWHLEIVGPGKGRVGAIWAAQRVPDDHVAVNANASRIREIDLEQPDHFMASRNVCQVAEEMGWWHPGRGNFQFNYAYDPDGRQSLASRRREWRVLDMLAPSLKLQPNSENYPFSVKPDSLVSVEKLVSIFQDYYEGTDFNPIKDITVADANGKMMISPLANPFMPYDMLPLFKINGGWGWRGERTIARWYTMYATITQSRSWLPDPIGGVVWLALDNAATSIYVPFYGGISDVAAPYKVDGRRTGMNRACAWWAFNHLGILTAQRWGEMRQDVTAVWQPLQRQLFSEQKGLEAEALRLYQDAPQQARDFLTRRCVEWGDRVVGQAWKTGDWLWTKYDEKF